jgi:hypothetical protein
MASSNLPITIVSGLPRSGTSVTMQMIHAGGLAALTDEIRSADVDNPRGYFEFEPVKKTKQDPSWLPQARGKVVKMVHMLLLDLPLGTGDKYRVVMTHREANEVLASQAKMLERLGRKGGAVDPAQLKQIFQQQMTRVLKHLADHPNDFSTCEVSYNEMVSSPRATAERLNTFLGGTLDIEKMVAAVDSSLYRNRLGPT